MPAASNIGQELSTVTGTRSTSGVGSAILPTLAANQRYVFVLVQLQNEDVAQVTVLLKSGSTTLYRLLTTEKGVGALIAVPHGFKWVAGWGEEIFLDLSAAAAVNYCLLYYVEYR